MTLIIGDNLPGNADPRRLRRLGRFPEKPSALVLALLSEIGWSIGFMSTSVNISFQNDWPR
jgi:hypothetical protein